MSVVCTGSIWTHPIPSSFCNLAPMYRIFKTSVDLLTVRCQHWLDKKLCIPCLNTYLFKPLTRLVLNLLALVFAAVGIFLAVIAIAVKVGIVASKVTVFPSCGVPCSRDK